MIRRLIDIAFAALVLTLCLPLLALVAIAVRINSPGNPFYGGWRAGKDGRPFRMWKFRTMVTNADKIGPGITARRDSRLTGIGPFLRSTKMDELPQFANLLMGDLTLIGPRPEVPDVVARYLPHQREVLAYRPGVTGVGALHYSTAQADLIPDGVAADEFYIEHLLDEKLVLEINYEKNRNFLTDIQVVGATVALIAGAWPVRNARRQASSITEEQQ